MKATASGLVAFLALLATAAGMQHFTPHAPNLVNILVPVALMVVVYHLFRRALQ